MMTTVNHRLSSLRLHPHLLGLLTSLYLKGRKASRADCWTYQMVFPSESSGGKPEEIWGDNGAGGKVL